MDVWKRFILDQKGNNVKKIESSGWTIEVSNFGLDFFHKKFPRKFVRGVADPLAYMCDNGSVNIGPFSISVSKVEKPEYYPNITVFDVYCHTYPRKRFNGCILNVLYGSKIELSKENMELMSKAIRDCGLSNRNIQWEKGIFF